MDVKVKCELEFWIEKNYSSFRVAITPKPTISLLLKALQKDSL